MLPRRRRQPPASKTLVQAVDLAGGDSFRPMMTGAFARHRPTPSGATPMSELPDPLSFVFDEDSEAPKLALL
jgi:hypothetical protein